MNLYEQEFERLRTLLIGAVDRLDYQDALKFSEGIYNLTFDLYKSSRGNRKKELKSRLFKLDKINAGLNKLLIPEQETAVLMGVKA